MKRLIISLWVLLFPLAISAQVLPKTEAEVKLSKDARRSGSYFGGGIDKSTNQVVVIMTYLDKKEGTLFDVYRFDKANNPLEPSIGLTMDQLAEHLYDESTNTDQTIGNEIYDGKKVILVRSNFIGRDIVIEKGHLEHEQKLLVKAESPGNPFVKSRAWMSESLLFKKEEKEKVDLDMMPMGTLVSEGDFPQDVLNKIREASTDGPSSTTLIGTFAAQAKEANSAVKAGLNAAFMQPGGKAVVIGRVVEKVKIRNPDPWNNNRLRVALVDGETMDAKEKTTYIMPFAFIPAHTQSIHNNTKMIALLVPLNSPNTIKEAKKYQMDKENRNRVMVTIVNEEGNIEDTIQYRSFGNNGKYTVYEHEDGLYIPAVVDADKSGFYNGNVNKPTHFQLTKVVNGRIAYHKGYHFDEIPDRVVVASGEKFKKLKVGSINWTGSQKLKGGNMVFFANDEKNFYAFRCNSEGELTQLYLMERVDKKSKIVDSQIIHTPNGKQLWMMRETPEGVQDVEIDLSTSTSSSYNALGGRTQTTTATATPRNVLEIKAVCKLVQINEADGSLGPQQIIGGKDFLVVGDSGYLMNDNGEMVMIGYDMEKKKKLFSVKLQP